VATIKDVATLAGVSLGTASRVMNRHPAVSPVNVDKVLRAARELGYKRLRRAAGAPVLRSGAIGLVLLGLDRTLATLPVVAAVLHSVQAAAANQGADLLVVELPNFDRVPNFIGRNAVDGLIVKGPLMGRLPEPGSNACCDRLRMLPTVWVLGRPSRSWGDHCGPDNWAIGKLAAESLSASGHRRLAFINARAEHSMFDERQAAFEWHARRLGAQVGSYTLPSDPRLPQGAERGEQAMTRLLRRAMRSKRPPTAIFVPGDSMAVLLYRACATLGLAVGRDLAVLSCNHEPPLTAGLSPSLATVDVHAEHIGRRAVEQLCWRLSHREEPSTCELLVAPQLVPGASSPPSGSWESRSGTAHGGIGPETPPPNPPGT